MAAVVQAGSKERSDDGYTLKAEGTDFGDTSLWALGDSWGTWSLCEKELEQNRRRRMEMTLVRKEVNGKYRETRTRGFAAMLWMRVCAGRVGAAIFNSVF